VGEREETVLMKSSVAKENVWDTVKQQAVLLQSNWCVCVKERESVCVYVCMHVYVYVYMCLLPRRFACDSCASGRVHGLLPRLV